ncbi:MAG: response regulator [Rhodospirillaceae bacterium]|nr:response regulator [Rhodospirillaceae bacterium]
MAYDLSKLRILLAEDDRSVRHLLRDILQAFGVGAVEMATDGETAYELMRHYAADIVIADWMMAPMNGLELLRKVRLDPESPNPFVPMIILTGYTEEGRVMACRNAGVTSYLAKPITPRRFYHRIVSVIEDRRPFIRTDTYFGPDLGNAVPFGALSNTFDNDAVVDI